MELFSCLARSTRIVRFFPLGVSDCGAADLSPAAPLFYTLFFNELSGDYHLRKSPTLLTWQADKLNFSGIRLNP
ncbi:hypothetical protein H7K23_14725 [Paracoccus yeei]|nr:hypothetical protein [Paracoccus yeei]